MASVNGIQLHYVKVVKEILLFCCMGFRNHGMNGDI